MLKLLNQLTKTCPRIPPSAWISCSMNPAASPTTPQSQSLSMHHSGGLSTVLKYFPAMRIPEFQRVKTIILSTRHSPVLHIPYQWDNYLYVRGGDIAPQLHTVQDRSGHSEADNIDSLSARHFKVQWREQKILLRVKYLVQWQYLDRVGQTEYLSDSTISICMCVFFRRIISIFKWF